MVKCTRFCTTTTQGIHGLLLINLSEQKIAQPPPMVHAHDSTFNSITYNRFFLDTMQRGHGLVFDLVN